MSRRRNKSEQTLKVTVRFEASRIATDCLASAYEQIVPQRSGHTHASRETTNAKKEPPRQVGEMHG